MTSSGPRPIMPRAEIIPTNNGEILHFDGFLYHLKAASTSEPYEWKCKRFECPGTALSSDGGRSAVLVLGHSHEADLDEVEALRLVYRMKRIMSAGSSKPMNTIIKNELAQASPGVRSKLSRLENVSKSIELGEKSCKNKSNRKGGRKTFKQSDKFYRVFLYNFMKDPVFNWDSIDKALLPLYKGIAVRRTAFVDILKNRKKVELDIARLKNDPNALIVSLEEGEKNQQIENQLPNPVNCESIEIQPVIESEKNSNNTDTDEEDDIQIIIPPCPAAKPIQWVRPRDTGKKSMLIDLTDDQNENENVEENVVDLGIVRNNNDQSDDCIVEMEPNSTKLLNVHNLPEPQDLNIRVSTTDKKEPESVDKQSSCIQEIVTRKRPTTPKNRKRQNPADKSTSRIGRRCKSDDLTHGGFKNINVLRSQPVTEIHYATPIGHPVLPLSELKMPLQYFASMDKSLLNYQQKRHKRSSSTNK